MNNQTAWWKKSVVYQIYPKSFYDSDGDGFGDLNGIREKLSYLEKLGVDVIWLNPIYESPQVDNGYDISNYKKIEPQLGTMEDFDMLLKEAHEKGIRIILDLVVNHTSDKHPWFTEAKKGKENPYHDYYIWKDTIPNNWGSSFGGPAWEYVEETAQYYLHLFAKEQPDLNWENPTVRQKIYEMINWWLDKGLSGFRIDAIINIKKNLDFPDFEPDAEDGLAACYKMVESAEGVGELLEELKNNTFKKYDAFTVGEVFNMKPEELPEFIGENGHFSTIFDFCAQCLSDGEHGWYDAPKIDFDTWRKTILGSQLETEKYGFKANIIENHDEPRGASRFLPRHAQNPAGIKMLGTVSVLLRGIPFIYQGQEIGMQNAKWNSIDEYDDISTKDQYKAALAAGLSKEQALAACGRMSRDNARTPMQWSDEANAGFTTAKPWLKVNENYKAINVAAQEKDPSSVLNYYRRLVALRKSDEFKELFTYGRCVPAYEDTDGIMAYYREDENKRVLVVANFGSKEAQIRLDGSVKKVLLSNTNDAEKSTVSVGASELKLESCEVLVVLVK